MTKQKLIQQALAYKVLSLEKKLDFVREVEDELFVLLEKDRRNKDIEVLTDIYSQICL